ncbi:MAG TPA: hypothetical protein EYP71_02235 [Dehalococcoidia bacterium]|nr:hypothetical protein [Dehalococcoidia bacterium]
MPLTEAKARKIAEQFLFNQYFDSKLDFTTCQLVDRDNVQVYELRGTMTMRSRNPMSRFVAPKTANQYQFRIEIDSHQGEIIGYEIS